MIKHPSKSNQQLSQAQRTYPTFDYSDIINAGRPKLESYPHMSVDQRAAQFAPYAALVGHKDIIAQDEANFSTQTDLDHNITFINEVVDPQFSDNLDTDTEYYPGF